MTHPLLTNHPKFASFCDFIAKWFLLAEGMVGVVDIVQNWNQVSQLSWGFLIAFNHKDGLITNHIASIAAISAVSLFFFFQGGFTYKGSLNKAIWICLIIGVHENLWWLTHLFFLRGQALQAYLFYGSLNYPMAMLLVYLLVYGWGKRETILLFMMVAYYIAWGFMGFHITSDVTGPTIWVNSISTNITESLSWIYVCAMGLLTYYWNKILAIIRRMSESHK